MSLQPLSCESCGRRVLVEKFSPAHTSIQWVSDSSGCPLIAATTNEVGHPRRSCPALRTTIDNAVRDDELTESQIELPVGASIPRLH
jgi:hypothetical protein